jgi:hypothetical protein
MLKKNNSIKNQFVKEIERTNLLSEYVGVLKSYLGLTERQSQVLSELLNLYLSDTPNILNKESRRIIIEKTGIGYTNLSSIVSLLKYKQILTKREDDNRWSIDSKYLPQVDRNNCYISLHLKIQ